VIEKSILPMLDRLVKDEIPNIRFNVAKTYSVLIDTLKRLPENETIQSMEQSGKTQAASPKGQELIQRQIMPNLEKLRGDDDVDVRYFATTASESLGDAMQT
jgi:serine/threonine-protein phosphatase 2A regulatory subunit A